MKYVATTALKKIRAMKKRLKIIQGGSSAGKTIAILLILINKAQTERLKTISVVAESVPHLKRAAMRDFLNIMEGHGYFKEENWDRTNYIYTFETGSVIEFFSADNPSKVKGPRRDILFENECNHLSFDIHTQLVIRTNEEIYLDYNPSASFWVHEEIIPKNNDHDFIILTYKDNEGLPKTIVDEIESRKGNKNFWKVYGLGELGNAEGVIYSNWAIIDELPHEARLERYGLDFGYTNDPTAIVAVYYYNGGYILDEITFQKGLSNKQIADILANIDHALVIADSAEPKSIDELKSYGINILPCEKGRDSVRNGIALVQDQKISVTKRSTNIIKEYRNYLWATDKQGAVLNVPESGFDHSLDAVRYAVASIVKVGTPSPRDLYQVEQQRYERTQARADFGI